MTSTADEDVVDNKYTAHTNVAVEDDYATISPKNVELKEISEHKSEDSNGKVDHSSYNVSTTSKSAPESGSKPFLPKIFIALLIVLLIAVIALCFVLYHLDKEVTKTKDKTSGVEETVKTMSSSKEDLLKKIQSIKDVDLQNIHNLTEQLKVLGKVEQDLKSAEDRLNEDIKKIKADEDAAQKDIKDKIEKIKTEFNEDLTKQIKEAHKLIEKYNGELTQKTADIETEITSANANIGKVTNDTVDLGKKIDTVASNLGNSDKKIEASEKKIETNVKGIDEGKNKTEDVEKYVEQLKMYIQMTDQKYKDAITLNFSTIVKLAGIDDKVSPPNHILKKLLDQVSSFKKTYKDKWGINYTDVMRLIDASDFAGAELTVLKKIDALFTSFTTDYETKWGIEFKGVIHLTKKSDLKDISVTNGIYAYTTVPLVLRKIDHLFTVFNTTYKPKWHIKFPDVFELLKDLNFAVDAKEIPVLQKISGWYVDNFEEIWGDNFEKLFHLIHKMSETELTGRTGVITKLKRIAAKNTLKFLPATIASPDGNGITISGYVKILLNKAWGTIWNRKNETVPFSDNNAVAVCRHGGYTTGKYDNCAYCKGTVDRTNMTCLLSKLQCFGTESSPLECPTKEFGNPNVTWSHDKDVGIKCTL